jgi:hypothetical protein
MIRVRAWTMAAAGGDTGVGRVLRILPFRKHARCT